VPVGWLVVLGLGLLALLPPAKVKAAKAPASGLAPALPSADVPLTLPDMYTIVDLAAHYEVDVNVLKDLEQRLEALSAVDYSWRPYLAKVQARLGS